jgi:hypothetical protein
LGKYYPDRDGVARDQMLQMIEKIFNRIGLISVFSLGPNMELDEAILNALLKAREFDLQGNLQKGSN